MKTAVVFSIFVFVLVFSVSAFTQEPLAIETAESIARNAALADSITTPDTTAHPVVANLAEELQQQQQQQQLLRQIQQLQKENQALKQGIEKESKKSQELEKELERKSKTIPDNAYTIGGLSGSDKVMVKITPFLGLGKTEYMMFSDEPVYVSGSKDEILITQNRSQVKIKKASSLYRSGYYGGSNSSSVNYLTSGW